MQQAPAPFPDGVGREEIVRRILYRVAELSDRALGWARCLPLDLGLDVFLGICFSCAV